MVLPEELTLSFQEVAKSYEEAGRMRFVSYLEELAIEHGIEEGILRKGREDVIEILEIRFGEVPSSIVEIINGINQTSVLKTLLRRAISIESVAEFQQFLEQVLSEE